MAASDHINPSLFGYRTDHTKWWDLERHRDHEVNELGNEFPDISQYPNHEGIWVTHSEQDAERYGDNVREVDLKGAQPLHSDGDGGYMYIRPKSK